MKRITENQNDNRMLSAQITAPEKISYVNTPIPHIGQYEILIKMEGCGICGSNLPLWEGRPWFSYPVEPGAPGHEGWGRVVLTGEKVDKFKAGDRVSAISFHAFAQYDKVDQRNAILIPDQLKNMPFPGEALGCAMNVWERSRILPGQKLVIIGIGFLGALLCQLASSCGVSVMAVSRRKCALDTAKKCGANYTCFLSSIDKTVESVNQIFEDGCDCVIEATGYQISLSVASELLKNYGRLIIAGYHQDGLRQVNMQQWNWKGIDVINAHERDSQRYVWGMSSAADAMIKKKFQPQILFSHEFHIEQLADAFELLRNRPEGFMKALVTL